MDKCIAIIVSILVLLEFALQDETRKDLAYRRIMFQSLFYWNLLFKACMSPQRSLRFRVSILVLLEFALQVHEGQKLLLIYLVSILVLLEFALQVEEMKKEYQVI